MVTQPQLPRVSGHLENRMALARDLVKAWHKVCGLNATQAVSAGYLGPRSRTSQWEWKALLLFNKESDQHTLRVNSRKRNYTVSYRQNEPRDYDTPL